MEIVFNIIVWLIRMFFLIFAFLYIGHIILDSIKSIIGFFKKKFNDRNANIIVDISKTIGGYDFIIKNTGRNVAKNVEITNIKVFGPNIWERKERFLIFDQISSQEQIFLKSIIKSDYIMIPHDNQLLVKLRLKWEDKYSNKFSNKEEIKV